MRKNNIAKGIAISGSLYAAALLIEGILQIVFLRASTSLLNFIGMFYYAFILVKPIILIVFIIYCCKALAILLKAALILIDKNEQS